MAFREVPIDHLEDYASLFAGPQLALLRQSVAAGNTIARLWVAAGQSGADIAFLWDFGNKGLYVAGLASSVFPADFLRRFVREELLAVAQAAGLKYFSVRGVSADAVLAVNDAFAGHITGGCKKLFYECPVAAIGGPDKLVDDVELVRIDAALLSGQLANTDKVTAELRWMWPSLERFSQQGWGVAALLRDQIICWCTSEYVGPVRCGIGIETIAAHRNKGVATAAALQFVKQALGRGKTPCWECHSENKASIRAAEKLGFVLTESTEWHLGRWQ